MNCNTCGKWAGAYAGFAKDFDLCSCQQPQREWQSLTDEERKEIMRQQKDFWGPVGWEWECMKAVEVELREKNT